jgi:UDP-N-acetylmuramoyl-L-alanyl-D-glutamate--2,6-diaminopimelate ligase
VDGAVTVGALARVLGARLVGPPEVTPTAVTHDSRRVVAGTLFCCVVGAHADGHDFAPDAVAAGAVALLVERELAGASIPEGVPQLVVPDVRAALGPAAAAVLGHPAERLRTVGVTGTNGKTTVVTMIGHVLGRAGRRVGVIGTLTGERTTPEAPDLQAQLAGFVADGVTDVAMEVSSHALALHRVDGIVFDVAVFTNLGHDHLDFHGTPEAYFAAKATLFQPERSRAGVVDVDDVHGRLLLDASDRPLTPVRLADAHGLRTTAVGSTFTWRGHPVDLPVPGRHNVSNALLAAEACRQLDVDDDVIARALADVPVVPGRFEAVDDGQPFTVVVDYAHTPDALEEVLGAARELVGDGGITVVFGCGGDRDAAKRPAMGEVACRLADLVVLTNDNPRSEDPLRIIEEIRSGCSDAPVVEPDRRAAIRLALSSADPGDLVLIAGKGHERGQVQGDRVEPFDDREVAREQLAALGFGGAS